MSFRHVLGMQLLDNYVDVSVFRDIYVQINEKHVHPNVQLPNTRLLQHSASKYRFVRSSIQSKKLAS